MPPICRIGQLIGHVGLGENFEESCMEKKELRRRRFWRSAEEILEAKYSQKVGVVKSNAELLSVRGICLQVSHPDERHEPFVINFTFSRSIDDDFEISDGHCSCPAGSIARCKHAVALLLHLTTKSKADLEVWSCTVDRCYWKNAVKKFQQHVSEPIPVKKFCHPKLRMSEDEQSSFLPIPKSDFEKSEEYALILTGFSEKSAYVKHIVGRSHFIEDEAPLLGELSANEMRILEQAHSSNNLIKLDNDRVEEKLNMHDQDCINFFNRRIKVTKDEAYLICRKTRTQSNLCWRSSRQVRITGCIAHSLFTYANNAAPNWEKKCSTSFFSSFGGNADTDFGTRNEKVALQICRNNFGNDAVLMNVGFIISITYPWLGYSPDGFLLKNGEIILLECKCLKAGITSDGLDFLRQLPCLEEKELCNFVLKKRCKFYSQIQLGLFICNLKKAKLVLYNQKVELNEYIDVFLDIEYVKSLIVSLTYTYFNRCLPYLYSRRADLFEN